VEIQGGAAEQAFLIPFRKFVVSVADAARHMVASPLGRYAAFHVAAVASIGHLGNVQV
jgi:hypothetical protein